jgi:hypothetical protein
MFGRYRLNSGFDKLSLSDKLIYFITKLYVRSDTFLSNKISIFESEFVVLTFECISI